MWECVVSWVQWKTQQTLCQLLYDNAPGEKIPIPPYDDNEHPLVVFHDTHVENNLYRWVVFVLWLKAYPQSWWWYQKIQKGYPCSLPTIHTLVMTLWVNQKRRKRSPWQTPS